MEIKLSSCVDVYINENFKEIFFAVINVNDENNILCSEKSINLNRTLCCLLT